MSRTNLLCVLSLAATTALGCGAQAGGEEPSETTGAALTLMHCPLPPGSAGDAKKRLTGYIVADGVATSQSDYKYRLSVPNTGLADHISALISQAGVTGTTRERHPLHFSHRSDWRVLHAA
jgi:hypothetical protein